MSQLDDLLLKKRIIITAGTGGVGKTTLSAALAIRAALLGKRVIVLTIDPARRLATSLGVEALEHEPSDLSDALSGEIEKIDPLRMPADIRMHEGKLNGSLAALMPDTTKTFEDFAAELAPNEDVEKRILENPIFRIFAREYSGANEYMALQRLNALSRLSQYDCIIVDTPPSRNTLAFLDAPELLARFFEEKLIKWLVLPSNRLLSGGMRKALSLLEKLTGTGFMRHLFDFASSIFEVREPFLRNLRGITRLLQSEQTCFLLVSTPTPDVADEVQLFIRSIQEHGFHFEGVALNRCLSSIPFTSQDLDEASDDEKEALDLFARLQAREAQAAERLVSSSKKGMIYVKLPELARDVHSMGDLVHVALALSPQSQPPAR